MVAARSVNRAATVAHGSGSVTPSQKYVLLRAISGLLLRVIDYRIFGDRALEQDLAGSQHVLPGLHVETVLWVALEELPPVFPQAFASADILDHVLGDPREVDEHVSGVPLEHRAVRCGDRIREVLGGRQPVADLSATSVSDLVIGGTFVLERVLLR